MADIQTFIQEILSRKEEECKRQLEQTQQDQEQRLASELKLINQSEQFELDRLNKQIETDAQIAIQQIDNQKRNVLLQYKQDKLAHIFDTALNVMKNWSQAEFSHFFYGVIKQLDVSKHYTLHIGEHTLFNFKVTDLSLEAIQAQVPENNTINIPPYIQLATTKLAHQTGFILEDDSVQYNYLFDTLINEVQAEYTGVLLKQLDV